VAPQTEQSRAYALVSNLGSSLYQNRFDARSNFLVPMGIRHRLNQERIAFLHQKWTESLTAMGAKRVAIQPGTQQVDNVVGRLTWTRKMAALDQAQRLALQAMGVGPLKKGARQEKPTQSAMLEPLMTLDVYAQAKRKDRQKSTDSSVARGYTPAWRGRYLAAYYVSQLYAERAWTLHVLQHTGFADRSRRQPAFSMGADDPGVLEDVSVELVLPKAVPEVAEGAGVYRVMRHQHWSGRADPDIQPRLYLFRNGTPMALYNVNASGSMAGFATGKVGTSCFTATSKMSAPSFSLPAGELKAGGTCVFAGMAAQKKFGDNVVICRRCYATSANYGYAEAMLAGETRFRWALTRLRAGSVAMADALVAAISSYARDAKFAGRLTQELGVWKNGQLLYNKTMTAKAPLSSTNLRSAAALGMPAQIRNTADFFAMRGVPNGAVAGFFRIHDSGDFTVAHYQESYIEAWGRVGAALPYVQFWAPTRIWARRRERDRLDTADKRWVTAGFAAGQRVYTQGSAALPQEELAEQETLPSFDPAEAFAQYGETLLVGEQAAPGEAEAQISGAGGSSFTYVPNVRLCKKLISLTSRLVNMAIRPSALYVKTPSNPAFIPYVTVPVADSNGLAYGEGSNALTAGSGVNTKWVGAHSLDVATAQRRDLDPAGYIPVYDNRGVPAYQCPVYSQMIPKIVAGRPVLDKETGAPEMREATSCQAAGCRACWLALDTPISYGYH